MQSGDAVHSSRLDDERQLIAQTLCEIVGEAMKRKAKDRTASPYEKSTSFLKRATYFFVCDLRRKKRLARLEEVVKRANVGSKLHETIDQNPFLWALNYMRRHTEVLTPTAVRLFANQLLHADRHHVHVRYLIGFIYQCGSPDKIFQKVKNGTREPDFLDKKRVTYKKWQG